jgi:nucleoside phosphorylase
VRIGFVTALNDEARTLTIPEGVDTYRVEICGMGLRNAARAADHLIAQGVDTIFSWGTAGGIDPVHEPGTLVVYDTVVAPDGTRLGCDERLAAALMHKMAGLQAIRGIGCSVERALTSAVEKSVLAGESGGIAVDMESAAVAEHAAAAGLHFAAVRVIADPGDFDIPAAAVAAFAHGGQPRALAVLKALARRPRETGALLRLARCYRLSLAKLRLAARVLHPDFGTDYRENPHRA